MGRGERPIKLGDSSYSPKIFKVVLGKISTRGETLKGLGLSQLGPDPYQTPNASVLYPGSQPTWDKLRGQGGEPRPPIKVPKSYLSD